MTLFWENSHILSPLLDELVEKYIPPVGATTFVESECLRAVLKIHHDYCNNGFGNEMGRSLEYLRRHFSGTSEWNDALARVTEAAMRPWNQMTVDTELDAMIEAVGLSLKKSEQDGTLTPILEEVAHMPLKLIQLPDMEDEDEYS